MFALLLHSRCVLNTQQSNVECDSRRPSPTLRVTLLAAVFLACRFGLKLGLVPTLFITFSVRWFVVTPLPRGAST